MTLTQGLMPTLIIGTALLLPSCTILSDLLPEDLKERETPDALDETTTFAFTNPPGPYASCSLQSVNMELVVVFVLLLTVA